jgi:hypothetical protein
MQTCGCAGEIEFLRQHRNIPIEPEFDAGVHGHSSARRNGLNEPFQNDRSACEYWVGPVPTHILIYTLKVPGVFQLVTSLPAPLAASVYPERDDLYQGDGKINGVVGVY